MKLLALDTSGPVAGVALLSEDKIVYECAAVNRMTHSVNLLPMVEEAFVRGGLTLSQLNLLAVVVGPGSFTGVRIGVSTVKGMAHGANLPCVGVDALEALAAGISDTDAVLCPIQDARAGQVYGAAFRAGMPPVRLVEDMAAKLPEYLAIVEKLGVKLLFLGDGVETYRQAIADAMGARACFAPAHLRFLRPASVAMLAACHADQQMDYLALAPKYLRAPQAERARMAKEAAR